jgi:hypothetical protein
MACRVSFQATANTNVLTLFVQMGDGKFRSVSTMSTLCFFISRRDMTGRAGFGGSLDGLVCKHIHTHFAVFHQHYLTVALLLRQLRRWDASESNVPGYCDANSCGSEWRSFT